MKTCLISCLYFWHGLSIQFLPYNPILHCSLPLFIKITVLSSIWFILPVFLLNDSENSLIEKKYIYFYVVFKWGATLVLFKMVLWQSPVCFIKVVFTIYIITVQARKTSTKTSAQKVVHVQSIWPSLAQYWRELSSAFLPAGSSVQFVWMIFNSWFKILLKRIISDLLNRYFRYTGQLY